MMQPEPGRPNVMSRRELDRYLRDVAATGRLQTCLPIDVELMRLIDAVAERGELTPDMRAEAHRIRDLDEQGQRAQIARRARHTTPPQQADSK